MDEGQADRGGKGGAPPAGRDRGPSGEGGVSAALQFGITTVVFSLLGNWLDGRLGTSPLFLLLGMFLGAGAGFYSMYRKLTAGERSAMKPRDEAAPPDEGKR
jgi:F0F1-type ATP synthase assembly protein I